MAYNRQMVSELLRRHDGEPLPDEAALQLAELSHDELAPLLEAAAAVRDRHYGRRVSFSPKVFLPLTNLCRNRCDYCSFRRSPGQAGEWTMRPDEVEAQLLRARSQGEAYARALPAHEGRPPFVLVVDVGTVIEVYAEFSKTGGTYTPYPDPRSHRIALADLARPEVQDRLRRIWTDVELVLDPAGEVIGTGRNEREERDTLVRRAIEAIRRASVAGLAGARISDPLASQ